MELIYLYIGNVGRAVNNYGIGFSRRFHVDYNSKTGQLHITRNIIESYSSIYGDNILDIDLIVGKNGSGKSTALSILGLSETERLWEYPLSKNDTLQPDDKDKHIWFALYYIEDNYFAIEGYWCDALDFLREKPFISKTYYTLCFKYDFSTQTGKFINYLQLLHLNMETDFHRKLIYLYYENSITPDWVKPVTRINSHEHDLGITFERLKCEKEGLRGITKFLYDAYHDSDFMDCLGTKPGTAIAMSVDINNEISATNYEKISSVSDIVHISDFGRPEIDANIVAKYIYNGDLSLVKTFPVELQPLFRNQVLNNELSYKEAYIIAYLEQVVLHSIILRILLAEYTDEEDWSFPMPPKEKNQTQYEWQKAHLFSILQKSLGNDKKSYELASRIVFSLETISNKYFVNYTEMRVFPETMEVNFLDELMKVLDESTQPNDGYSLNHKIILRTEFKGISSGEARMIDIFAMLYNSLCDGKYGEQNTCVLLLDEPDIGFHPEWSRVFIEKLTNFLKSDMMNKYNYHIIISTHSPIMLSDVPKQCIHCISKDAEGNVEVKDSEKYGLISGINDVLIDAFFTDSLFGSFGEKYANRIISQIKELEDINQTKCQETEAIEKYLKECDEIKLN